MQVNTLGVYTINPINSDPSIGHTLPTQVLISTSGSRSASTIFSKLIGFHQCAEWSLLVHGYTLSHASQLS